MRPVLEEALICSVVAAWSGKHGACGYRTCYTFSEAVFFLISLFERQISIYLTGMGEGGSINSFPSNTYKI